MREIKILVVDDDMGICQSLGDILEAKGYQVDIALDGFQAIGKVKEKDFDVILLDIKMPGINGVETFRRIKKISLKPRVIMITAYAVEDLIREAHDEGVYKVLRKPLEMERVIGLIEAAVGGE